MIKLNKIAFFTVFYPGAEVFFKDFASSLENQSESDFTITYINDGMLNLPQLIDGYKTLKWEEFFITGSPERIREKGLVAVKNAGYDIIILGDADDYFSQNRIEVSIKKLIKYDIVINDITPFSKLEIITSNYFSNRIKNMTPITLDYIEDKNIFGLSNTAFKRACIDDSLSIREDSVATDWLLYSKLLASNKKAVFTNETSTFYRQHLNNTAGLGKISELYIKRGITAKKVHFEELSKVDSRFKVKSNYFYKKEKEMMNLESFCNYVNQIKKNKINYPLWWEEII